MNINATLFVQALSFAALIWFTVKFVWPMITNTMDERARRISDGLAAAEAGRQSLERSAKQATVAIDDARTRAEAERERQAAKADIEQDIARAREELRSQLAALVVAGAEKILRREVDSRAHADMLDAVKQQF